MNILNQKNNNDELKNLFYNLFNSYRININPIYHFVYDEFFEHLVTDTNNYILKNYDKTHYTELIDHKKAIFKGKFYKHYSNSQWFYKIFKPEENKEVINELRNRKLKEIEMGASKQTQDLLYQKCKNII